MTRIHERWAFHISQQFLPILEGISLENQNHDEAGFISHLKIDEKFGMDVISG